MGENPSTLVEDFSIKKYLFTNAEGMQNYRKGSHAVYDLKVHLVFIPKYRKRVLFGQIAEQVRMYIRQICEELDIQIIS
jgi:hypothetical protein